MKKYLGAMIVLGMAIVGGRMWRSRIELPHSTTPSIQPTEKATIQISSQKLLKSEFNLTSNEKQATFHKIQILEEIFHSKNDNDPRLDQEFNQLSEYAKQALEQEYDKLKKEDRNEKGTIVFLLGRNLSSKNDFDFMHRVLSETPCKSLENCDSQSMQQSSHDDPSFEVTLQYPQIVALKSLENYLMKNPSSTEAKDLIHEAMNSKSLRVSQIASSLHQRFSN